MSRFDQNQPDVDMFVIKGNDGQIQLSDIYSFTVDNTFTTEQEAQCVYDRLLSVQNGEAEPTEHELHILPMGSTGYFEVENVDYLEF